MRTQRADSRPLSTTRCQGKAGGEMVRVQAEGKDQSSRKQGV